MSAPVRSAAERGSAIVEFVVLGVLLLVPTVYLVVTLAQVQAATFAVEAGVREAGRALATADDEATGRARAQAAILLAAEDQHVARPPAMRLECAATPCLTPGSDVVVHAATSVPLPLLPDGVVRALGAEVTVQAQQQIRIDPYGYLGGGAP